MKKLYTLFLSLTAALAFSQAPNLINYQGVARSANGNPIITPNIALRFEILQGANAFYSEDQTGVAVNSLGLFSTQIGKNGTLPSNWANGTYSLKVSIDTLNGTNFVSLGSQQLVSVPFALNAPAPNVSLSPSNVLTIGPTTLQLPTTSSSPSLTINGSNLSISGANGNTVSVWPTLTVPGSTVSTNGTGYVVNTQSTTVSQVTMPFALPGLPIGSILGLAQVVGTYPNYSVVVAPEFTYNQSTGDLEIKNRTNLNVAPFNIPASPGYTYAYNITQTVGFSNGVINVGPPTNTYDLSGWLPWRRGTGGNPAAAIVRLGNNAEKVVIGSPNPPQLGTAELLVDGYTKLGVNSPGIQVAKITGYTTSGSLGGSVSVPLPSGVVMGGSAVQISANQILSISVLADPTNGADWVSSGNTVLTSSEFHWHVLGSNIVVTNSAANSNNILNVPLKIIVTFEP